MTTSSTTTGTGVRAVWTDFGGVLTPPPAQTFTALCERTGVDPEPLLHAVLEVTARYGTDDMMLPLDTPLVTEDEWLRQVVEVLEREHGVRVRITSLADTWFDDRETNKPWVDSLEDARRRDRFVGMLSNMPPAWDEHWRRMVPHAFFDDVVMSFEVGLRKPGREIFDLAAERAGVLPQECLLVDDLVANCEGAVAAGWRALHFTDTALAVTELERLLD
ncbi:putative hydrolase of the HAD superfamily [Nocardiopsis sp. Huas11]|uniref:HAD family hydrolase n=1 Tax=Nocardiopsis sp. Huas11 TaxID=2183912 RepID=UPI000EAEF0AB|nr:HAD family phosphatase [Nocardiopsis sp. Huas11]RKS09658.1 putative hydrolase of the HAD superfamily [Nocardiopsis sp. Huas11]